ncbi:MAG: hypothetical protein IJ222_11120 [Bacteroidales bacterium]|nr:hypothetical protein [Bacteroidales bacterium]
MDLQEFILAHENDDPATLVLQRGRYPSVDVALAAECIAARRKLRLKVPQWYAEGLVCPSALSAEQCSSTATALYKAGVASAAAEGPEAPRETNGRLRIADLTGGLGVDSWQFSKTASRVLYNEMNPLLLETARANLPRLGCNNVEFSGICITPETLPALLGSFKPDLVFADPARRSASGRKVFLPEDCSPDVLALQDIILAYGCCLLLKLSPMADISLMLRKFHCVKEVHVVEADGECKELLLLLEPGFEGDTKIIVAALGSGEEARPALLDFNFSEIGSAAASFISDLPRRGQFLFEPGPALSKSGAFNLLSTRFGLPKLGPSAHLYLNDAPTFDRLAGLGKWFSVQEAAPFGKAALRDFAARWPEADVTARALPLSSDELRARMKIRGSGNIHIFGIGSSVGKILLACTPGLTGASRYFPDLR